MISCRQARHLFDAFLDDDLSPQMRAELHAHRLNCAACSHELALLEACGDVIRTDRREPSLHEDFTDRFLVAFGASHNPSPTYRLRRLVVTIGSPLAAAAVLVFAYLMWARTLATPTSPVEHRTPVVLFEADRMPDPIMKDLTQRSGRMLSAEELAEMKRAEPLPVGTVLQAWLQPVVERTNNTLDRTRRNASQLAQFVQFGIIPEAVLLADQGDAGSRDDADVGADESSATPWLFDSLELDADHPSQPSTESDSGAVDLM